MVFALVLVGAGVGVITARSPVHAALFLVLAFFTGSGLWMMLEAEFLAIVLVLVYVGAVMVLFLFVVMMLNIDSERLRQGFWKHLPLGGGVALLMVLEMWLVVSSRQFSSMVPDSRGSVSNTKELGRILYTDYVLSFELAAVILLVAIVAAIALTLRRRKDSKHLDPAQQVKAKAADRLRIVSMPAEREL
ncbi:NADH-quinone oxidoreductase subunit J [Ferrovum sp.]|uniref:NADH-quinone oxidoreductase subunit J n=1 Tax=Ferrovum sp. TaxID=2609467 RepID=UPI00273862ED|nr:NADH-quinone oxidoreductase subunit J [Ferrovum sp.]